MCRRTRCWRSDRDRVAIEELLRRWRAAMRRSSSCRGCQAFVSEPLPPWPQLSAMVVSRERAGLNDGVPDSRAEHMARRSDQRGQGPRPGPVPRAPRGLLHPGALNGRGRERVLSPSWPGPRCARPRAHVARHLAPCPAPRSPRPRAPLSAPARRSRYSPCPPAPLAGARRPRPQAAPMRGAGGARARATQAGWCLCAASVRRVRVLLCEFTNPTQTHTKTRPARRKMPWS